MTRSQVKGATVQVTTEGVMDVFRGRIEAMLCERGIEPVHEDEWYSLEEFTAVLAQVRDDAGENALQKIGEAVPVIVEWPVRPDAAGDAIDGLDAVYDHYHRNATGGYETRALEDGEVTVASSTPYPCAFEQGLLQGIVKEYDGAYPRVTKADGACRDEGARECVYDVRW